VYEKGDKKMAAHPVITAFLLILLLGFSAFFSGSETALMAVSKLRLTSLEKEQPFRARLIEKTLRKPEKLIGTILLGNNLVNVAMSALATVFAVSLWGEEGIIYVTVLLTLAILIFAEITPKVYARYYNERVSLFTIPVLVIIMKMFAPVTALVTAISTKLLLLVGVNIARVKRPLFTEAELQSCIKMAWDDRMITTQERQMLSRVFTLNDKQVRDVMVPEKEAVFLHAKDRLADVIEKVNRTGYSRFPVLDSKGEKVIGFVHGKDILRLRRDRQDETRIKSVMRPPYVIPGDRTIDVQLRQFQTRKLHQGVVLDHSGAIAGIVTLEDILEELVGAIQDEHDAT